MYSIPDPPDGPESPLCPGQDRGRAQDREGFPGAAQGGLPPGQDFPQHVRAGIRTRSRTRAAPVQGEPVHTPTRRVNTIRPFDM